MIWQEAKEKHAEGLLTRDIIENKITACDTDRQQAIDDIQRHYKMLQNILDKKKQHLLSQLDKLTESKVNILLWLLHKL